MVRTGIFISHAHEDHELAESVRRLLETALDLNPADVTCTSDPDYGLKRGDDLRDAIRHRLDAAKALFLLATPAARQKDWVNFECGYADAARARGEMAFYILAPTPSLIASVADPYTKDVAVTLSDGADVHAFVGQLRQTFTLTPANATAADYVAALLKVEQRCAALALQELKSEHLTEVQSVRAELTRVSTHRNWKLAAACLLGLVLAALGSWWISSSVVSSVTSKYEAALKTSKDDHSRDMEEASARWDQELKKLPFSGLVGDGTYKPLKCTTVEALVPDGRNRPVRHVAQTCNPGGTFTFSGDELQADPRDPITLLVNVGGTPHRLQVYRSKEVLAIPILGNSAGDER